MSFKHFKIYKLLIDDLFYADKKLPPNFIDILNVELCKRGIPSATVGIGNSGVSENPNANQKLNHMSGTKVLMMPETGSLSRISELTVGLSRRDLLPRKPLQNLGWLLLS